MNFLSPAFLFALPLLAVPLAIHLLSKRQQKKISWGAMRFLIQAATRKRRLWRLTDILLLLLRTAAFLFFIFALARPLLPATWLGGAVPRDVILVLDRSLSTSRQVGGEALFEAVRREGIKILGQLSGNDSIRVLLAGESPEWLGPDPLPATVGTQRKVRSQIEQLAPTLGAADLIGGVREAIDFEAPKDKSARVIYVVTDGQRFGWRMDEKPFWSAIETRLRQSPIPVTVGLRFVGPAEPAGNLAVDRMETPRPFGAVDQGLTFTAAVANHGPTPSSATLLSWRVNGQAAGVTTVPELGPDASTPLSLNISFPSPGIFDVTCQIENADELPADNEGHVLVQIYDRLPVLVVEDPASTESLENDAPFIQVALGARPGDPRSAWHSVFEPTVTNSAALESTDLRGFRCVVLANTRDVSPAVIERLEGYAQEGGGVWFALGSQTDERFFNEHWHRGGLGLAPLRLESPVGDPTDRERFFALRAASDVHPATALLADFQRLDLDRARVYRRHQFDPLSGKDVSILLQAEGGEPVVVERKFGRGRVLVQGIPLGVSWSTLPLCQAYVALLHEWLWYLSEANLPHRNLAVGDALLESTTVSGAVAELTLPDQTRVEVSASDAGAGWQFRYEATRVPGAYVLQAKGTGNQPSAAPFYVRRNPQESDLKTLNDGDRERLAAAGAFRIDEPLDRLARGVEGQAPKHPLEGWFFAALPIVLLGEMAVAGWTSHRRSLRLRARPIIMEA